MNFKLNSREAETQELLELEKSLPEDLPEISLLLLQTARNKLKLDEIRKADESELSNNYKPLLRYQEIVLENL